MQEIGIQPKIVDRRLKDAAFRQAIEGVEHITDQVIDRPNKLSPQIKFRLKQLCAIFYYIIYY